MLPSLVETYLNAVVPDRTEETEAHIDTIDQVLNVIHRYGGESLVDKYINSINNLAKHNTCATVRTKGNLIYKIRLGVITKISKGLNFGKIGHRFLKEGYKLQ
jgi:hypothetical protein